jgi:hypothetical protein
MDMGGGGGAGGVIYKKNYSAPINVPIVVTVGAGGAGSLGPYGGGQAAGSSGADSIFGNLRAVGGGGGGSGHYFTVLGGQGQSGGSGGGDATQHGYGRRGGGGSGIAGQGYKGGGQSWFGQYSAGGGGGAGQRGGGGSDSYGGKGGQGFLSDINGTSLYWGGGGGGGGHTIRGGDGGLGGGGGGSAYGGYTPGSGGGSALNAGANGVGQNNGTGGNAGANTGGGGGGGSHWDSDGGNGGSGIVIVRYYGSQRATGGTITSSGGYTIHTFTSSGTFTPTGFLNWGDTASNDITGIPFGAVYNSSDSGSFSFDNVDDYIDVIPFNATTITNCTIEAWVFDSSSDTNYRSIVQNNVAGDDALYVNPSNYLQWWPSTQSTLTVPRNQWVYVAASHTYGSGILYQVNGDQQFIGGTFEDPTDWDFMRIGGHSSGDGERWGGRISVVRVHNQALSASDLTRNFQSLRSRYGI